MHNRKGFTLIELLIVVIVIGILAGAGIGKYMSFAEKARTRVCMSNQNEIGNAVAVWCTTNQALPENGGGWLRFSMTDGAVWISNCGWGGNYPWGNGDTSVAAALRDRNAFLCPGSLSVYYHGDKSQFYNSYGPQSQVLGLANAAYCHVYGGPNAPGGFSWAHAAYGGWFPRGPGAYDMVFCGEWGWPGGNGPDGSPINRHSSRW